MLGKKTCGTNFIVKIINSKGEAELNNVGWSAILNIPPQNSGNCK